MIPLSRENYTFWLDVEGSYFFAGQLRLLYDFLKISFASKGPIYLVCVAVPGIFFSLGMFLTKKKSPVCISDLKEKNI